MVRVRVKKFKASRSYFEEIKSFPRILNGIFRNLSYQDKLQLRLVSKLLFEITNANCTFTLTLNDQIPELSQISQLPIRICVVRHLLTSEWGLTTLQFPAKLRKLVISGPMSYSNFLHLQNLDLHNLHELVIETDQISEDGDGSSNQFRMVSRSTSMGMGIWFPYLKSLSITGPSSKLNNEISSKIFQVIMAAKFPALKKLKVQVECNEEDETTHLVLILGFLARHCQDLKDISVIMTQDPVLDPKEWKGVPVPLAPIALCGIRQDQLKAVKAKRLLISPVASGTGGPQWANFLYNQTKLESLESHFHLCPITFYQFIINRNWHSLKEVTLLHLSCWEAIEHFHPLDLVAFHNCAALQSLTLARYQHDESPEVICPTVPDLIGAQNLPHSLKKLSLTGFRMMHDEFYAIGHGLSNLHDLTLIGCGHRSFGISGTCMEELLVHLTQLRTICIIGINKEIAAEEIKLKGIIAKVVEAGQILSESCEITSNPEDFKLKWTFDAINKNPLCPTRPHVSFNLTPTYFENYKYDTSNSTLMIGSV